MARGAIFLPALAGSGDHALVVAIEDLEYERPIVQFGRAGAVGQYEDLRAVRVAIGGGEPNGLILLEAVARAAMRQEPAIVVRPQRCIERLDALLRTGDDDGAIASRENLLEQLRQRALESRRAQLIKADLGQSTPPMLFPFLFLVMIGDEAIK